MEKHDVVAMIIFMILFGFIGGFFNFGLFTFAIIINSFFHPAFILVVSGATVFVFGWILGAFFLAEIKDKNDEELKDKEDKKANIKTK